MTISSYVNELKQFLIEFTNSFKSAISTVYVTRALKLISESTNNKYMESIFKFKKVTKNNI